MAASYLSGSLVRTLCTFANAAGTATDPTTVTLRYQPGPAAAIVTAVYPSAPVIKDSAGNYHADLDTTGWRGTGPQPWVIEWTGTGTVQAIGADNWQILPEPI